MLRLLLQIIQERLHLIRQTEALEVLKEEFLVFLRIAKLTFDEVAIYKRAIAFPYPIEVVRIRPIGRVGDQAIFDGISVDVAAEVE